MQISVNTIRRTDRNLPSPSVLLCTHTPQPQILRARRPLFSVSQFLRMHGSATLLDTHMSRAHLAHNQWYSHMWWKQNAPSKTSNQRYKLPQVCFPNPTNRGANPNQSKPDYILLPPDSCVALLIDWAKYPVFKDIYRRQKLKGDG